MRKQWFLAAGLASIITLVGLTGCTPENVALGATGSNLNVTLSNQQEGIWVSGSGKVSAIPDIAILRLGIEAQEDSVSVAQSQAAAAMTAVMSALEGTGVDEKDIQTQYFNIHRVTRWDEREGKEVVIGYRVTNMVTAKIRDMDGVGAIIDEVVIAGGDRTRIDSIGFTIEDPSPYQSEAREKAVADAVAKAGQLAEVAGIKLGNPVYITENAAYPYPVYRQDYYAEAAMAGAPSTPISPGEIEISLNVQVAFSIVE